MSFKCVHISDIHFRGLKRHDEYRLVFNSFFDKVREIKPDLIFVGGDIVHSKTQGISPELINILNWWFTNLANLAPTHVILGNHDGLILNQNRLDAITPIVEALNNPRLFLYKKSGTYPTGIKGFNWCVFSCFDEEGWKDVKPVQDEINIATFHGSVLGSLTDSDWELGGEVNLDFFKEFDFGFLGDIHKKQYLDMEKRIAYPGSTIQQNYGEELEKGFLVWNIENKWNYSSEFVKLDNPHVYITCEWKGNTDDTIKELDQYPIGARFRIKSESALNQGEIKLITSFLKEKKSAKEIIFKNDGIDQSIQIIEEKRKNFNIWNEDARKMMLQNYFGNNVTEDQLLKISKLFEKTLDNLPEDQNRKPTNWAIKSLEFSNTFSYGEDNFINFDNLNGIIGIFGKNAAGKSSIPGTLMYNLFNGTDRGSMKNIHIINTRKDNCETKAIIDVNNQKYLIERSTKKIPIKKKINEFYSPTDLSLKRIAEDGNIVNESDEQRRETEKVLRELIGTSDEFLMTSFASQGNINSFIIEKSGSRKHYLSKFMNLDIFEELSKIAKESSNEIKIRLKQSQEKNWLSLKQEAQNEILDNEMSIKSLEEKINDLSKEEIEIRLNLEKMKNKNLELKELHEVEKEIETLEYTSNKEKNDIEKNKNEISELSRKIEKFKNIEEQFNLTELKKEKERFLNLKSQLTIILNQLENTKKELKKKKEAAQLLSSVPCGDSFPTCRFIKNAHEDFNNLKQSEENYAKLEESSKDLYRTCQELEKEQFDEKIKKYEEFSMRDKENRLKIENLNQKISMSQSKIDDCLDKLLKQNQKLKQLKSITNEDDEEIINDLKNSLNKVSKDKDQRNVGLISIKGRNSYLEKMIQNYIEEEEKYQKMIEDWKSYESFIGCLSKKGIPSMLIKEMLPSLNKEVKDILHGVSDFTLDIEILDDDLEVYINYGGDNRRIVECGSGMEKMIASLAIRVGLINISNLPKSNIFIIDEGFGALDDTNIEACVRLLEGFKKYFKTILIISHVDAIKDIVEDTLSIEANGKDSYVRFE
jgi:DNA repair exonuclease SbcCD ATPase subunit